MGDELKREDIRNLTGAINKLQETIGSGGGTSSSWFSKSSATDAAFDAAATKAPIIGAIKAGFEGVQGLIRGISKVGGALYGAGVTQTEDYSTERTIGGERIFDLLSKVGEKKGFFMSAFQEIGDQIIYQLEDEARLRTKINESTGLTGKLSEDVRRSILDASPAVLQMGYGIERLGDFYTRMIEQSGRFNIVNKEILERTAQVSRAFVGDLSQMADHMSNFEKIGFGAADTLEYLNSIGVKSLELGLRSKKTVDDVTANLGKLNEYGFKNGVQGLAEMARKATEFRMNMENTFTIAEKVFSPEGAIELSAELSVIGGQLGAFNDPLKLMYMATNNVEGLQDALIEASKSLASYNVEQGRFEVTGINLRKAKAMADQLGISVGDLSKGAIAAAERTQAATALLSTGLKMSDEDREFITNMSQMEKGEMVIRVPESLAAKLSAQMGTQIETAIPLSQMTESLKNELIKNKDAFAKMDSKDIAMEQLNVQGKMERNLMAIAAVAKVRLSQVIKDTSLPLTERLEGIAAKFGMTVEDLTTTKGGKLNLLPGTEDFIKDMAAKVGLGGVKGIEEREKSISGYLKAVSEMKSTEAQKMTVENKFTFNATPSLLDSLGRHIARSPQTWEDIYGAHHESERSYTNGGRSF